jgi:hypothetical protein
MWCCRFNVNNAALYPGGCIRCSDCLYFVFGWGARRCSRNTVSCLASAPIFVCLIEKSCVYHHTIRLLLVPVSLLSTMILHPVTHARSEVLAAVLMIYLLQDDTDTVSCRIQCVFLMVSLRTAIVTLRPGGGCRISAQWSSGHDEVGTL